MKKSKIEWTDITWNPVTGCTRVSAGCDNCYAVRMTKRLESMGQKNYAGLVNEGKNHFNGTVKLHYAKLKDPFRWQKPRKVFVNSMSDLFHDDVDFGFIIDVLHTIEKNPKHIFQVLTKRPERAIEFFNEYAPNPYWGDDIPKNLWLGVSVEDQFTADERIPLLLQIPAKVKFLSCEPLLGPVDFHTIKIPANIYKPVIDFIDWVIVGGESGPGARPLHPDWVRSIRDQCKQAEVPFFFKQWGEYSPCNDMISFYNLHLKENHVFDDAQFVFKIGKKEAGNLLDGKQHLEFPEFIENTSKLK